MFWKTQQQNQSKVSQILDRDDPQLKDLLDDDYLLQELKCANKRLIEFLLQPSIIDKLLVMALSEPPPSPPETDNESAPKETKKYKYAHISTEVLTSEEPTLTAQLAQEKCVSNRLIEYVAKNPPLNPLLTSYYARILNVLLTKYSEKLMQIFKSADGFVEMCCRHLGTSAIVDFLFRLAAGGYESESVSLEIKNFLVSESFVQRLVALLSGGVEVDLTVNSSQLLCDLIRQLRESLALKEPPRPIDPLLNQLQSAESVEGILKRIFAPDATQQSQCAGMDVLLTLLQFQLMTAAEIDFDPDPDRAVVAAIVPRLGDFQLLLDIAPKRNPIALSNGIVTIPVGQTRLAVLRLFGAVLRRSNTFEVRQKFVDSETFSAIWKFFFAYPKNNFIHTAIFHCCQAALQPVENEKNGENENFDSGNFSTKFSDPLLQNLFEKVKISEIILKIHSENLERKSKNLRDFAYMGQIMQLANVIAESSHLQPFLDEKWMKFKSDFLQPYNDWNHPDMVEMQPGGSTPPLVGNDEDMALDGKTVNLSEGSQKLYNEYQAQELCGELAEKFGFRSTEFTEEDFNSSKNSESAFEQLCNEKSGSGSSAAPLDFQIEDDDEEWPEREISFGGGSTATASTTGMKKTRTSSSDEEMDTEFGDFKTAPVDEAGWANFNSFSPSSTTQPIMVETKPKTDDNWADFESAPLSPPKLERQLASISSTGTAANYIQANPTTTISSTENGPKSSDIP